MQEKSGHDPMLLCLSAADHKHLWLAFAASLHADLPLAALSPGVDAGFCVWSKYATRLVCLSCRSVAQVLPEATEHGTQIDTTD